MPTHPKQLSIQDFTYTLPEDRIAHYPLEERDASKLLICRDGIITEDTYRNIALYIPADSLLVFNNTKVVEARLLFQKPSGGQIEIFCLEPHEQYADITTAMAQKENVRWHCLVGGASKWKPGQVLEKKITYGNTPLLLQASFIEKRSGSFIIELRWTPSDISFAEVLHRAGAIPLPPYIKRAAEKSDAERYQTVYAETDGSVAAPTAGLHFTENIFTELAAKKIEKDFVTLHVGAGTFKPVKAASMGEHEMHAEWIDVSRKSIENLLRHLDTGIIAVGTTSLRTLESLYWLGVKSREAGDGRREAGVWRRESGPDSYRVGRRESGSVSREENTVSPLKVSQWDAYELPGTGLSAEEALRSLVDWMDANKLERLVTKTQLLIAPGYTFRIVKGLISNFHQPQSTLLLLVAALIGDDWRRVYDYALENNFRFLSYGDGCLLWRK